MNKPNQPTSPLPRRVLITGGSRGIGLAIAKSFVESGDHVIITARDATQLQRAADELYVQYIAADFSDYEQAQRAFAQIEADGPVDVLINNAGTAHFGLFTDMTPAQWHDVISNNLLTAINASHLAIPAMVRAKSGIIINITSIWGLTGASCEAVYAATKGAVCALTKSLAKELGPSNIRVNAIACGAIDTRMNDRLSSEEKSAFIDDIPLGRFGQPQEVGPLAVFLASDNASYLTGQIIALDGGVI